MQPLQRSYAITEERIEAMLSKGALSSLYDQAKVNELENAEELTGKEQKKLESFQNNQALYDEIITTLKAVTSEQVYNSPTEFMPVLTKALASATSDKNCSTRLLMASLLWIRMQKFNVTAREGLFTTKKPRTPNW